MEEQQGMSCRKRRGLATHMVRRWHNRLLSANRYARRAVPVIAPPHKRKPPLQHGTDGALCMGAWKGNHASLHAFLHKARSRDFEGRCSICWRPPTHTQSAIRATIGNARFHIPRWRTCQKKGPACPSHAGPFLSHALRPTPPRPTPPRGARHTRGTRGMRPARLPTLPRAS